MSDLELIELAFTRVRDSYRGSPDTGNFNLLDRVVNELRKVKHDDDPHHGLGRAGMQGAPKEGELTKWSRLFRHG